MKINCINCKNYSNQSFKAQPNKNYVEIKFNESDSENGSIAAAIIAMGVASFSLSKMKDKNLVKAGVITGLSFIVTSLATMGAISFAKIIKKLNNDKKTETEKN